MFSYHIAGRNEDADRQFALAEPFARADGRAAELAALLLSRCFGLMGSEHLSAAIRVAEEAVEISKPLAPGLYFTARAYGGAAHLSTGRADIALQWLLEVLERVGASGDDMHPSQLWSLVARCQMQLGRYADACASLGRISLGAVTQHNGDLFRKCIAEARVMLVLGQPRRAQAALDLPAGMKFDRPAHQAEYLFVLARVLEALGSSPAAALEQAEEIVLDRLNDKAAGIAIPRRHVALARAAAGDRAMCYGRAVQVLRTCPVCELTGFHLLAQVRCAAAALADGKPELALEHANVMQRLMGTVSCEELYPADVGWTLWQVYRANEDPRAGHVLADTANWILDVAQNQVPAEYRESFLGANSTNRAVLKAASAQKQEA